MRQGGGEEFHVFPPVEYSGNRENLTGDVFKGLVYISIPFVLHQGFFLLTEYFIQASGYARPGRVGSISELGERGGGRHEITPCHTSRSLLFPRQNGRTR